MLNEKKIQIGIALSKNSEKYLEFLLWTISKTAALPIKYYLGVNHGASFEEIKHIASNVDAEVFDAFIDSGYSSLNHGLCLDIIFSKMESGIGMLVDCDVAFIEKNWDVLMLSKLNDKCAIVGAEYDGDKYLQFPNVICAMFVVDVLKKLDISFKSNGSVFLNTDELQLIYGYNSEHSIILDTGCELPLKLKKAGFTGYPMPIFRAGWQNAKFMKNDMRGEEYQLDNLPLFTHLGRSYTREFGVDIHAKEWEREVCKMF